jgi:hypothetical protein
VHEYRYVASAATATGAFLAATGRNLGFNFERGPEARTVELANRAKGTEANGLPPGRELIHKMRW